MRIPTSVKGNRTGKMSPNINATYTYTITGLYLFCIRYSEPEYS